MTDYQKIACAMRQCKFNTDDCNACAINAECKKRRHFIEDYAADIIEELLAENEKLKKLYLRAETDATNLTGELVTVCAERDAAIDDIELLIHNDGMQVCAICSLCDAEIMKCHGCNDGHWRGVQRD